MLVTEVPIPSPPALVHPEWRERFPWLVQGCTVRGSDDRAFDLGLFSEASPARHVMECWAELRTATGMSRVVHAQQVHGAEVRVHAAGPAGLHLGEPCDGHVTATPGVLLAVTVADCVPVFVVAPEQRAVAALHAGWRGVADGILEAGVEALSASFGASVGGLHIHLGPSICGRCYEVGPEVFTVLDQPDPGRAQPIDLHRILADRAQTLGIAPERVTRSSHCTRCTGSDLFSHRGGDGGRQVGYLGVQP